MYKFVTEPYCENCPEFEVNDERDDLFMENFMSSAPTRFINHVITCKHRKRCANMVDWLKKNKEKEINNYDDSKQS